MRAKLTGEQLFWLTHVGFALWAVAVISVAVARDDAGYVSLIFAPALLVDWEWA
jgi:hypothetical protein